MDAPQVVALASLAGVARAEAAAPDPGMPRHVRVATLDEALADLERAAARAVEVLAREAEHARARG